MSRLRYFYVRGGLARWSSRAGGLVIPKTPVERIMRDAKLMKLKSDFLKREAERAANR